MCFQYAMSSRIPARMITSGIRIPCKGLFLKTALGQSGFLCLTSSIFSRFGTKCRLDNTTGICYQVFTVGPYYIFGIHHVMGHNFKYSLVPLLKREFLSSHQKDTESIFTAGNFLTNYIFVTSWSLIVFHIYFIIFKK